jgi:hypothetical protein
MMKEDRDKLSIAHNISRHLGGISQREKDKLQDALQLKLTKKDLLILEKAIVGS